MYNCDNEIAIEMIEVTVKGVKMAVILGWSGSEGLPGPGNTGKDSQLIRSRRVKMSSNEVRFINHAKLNSRAQDFVTINVPLFLEVRDFIFFLCGKKHMISHFAGSKNPAKWLIMCFSRIKK
jgi:hypothetical protein